jgi:hypothetical protein
LNNGNAAHSDKLTPVEIISYGAGYRLWIASAAIMVAGVSVDSLYPGFGTANIDIGGPGSAIAIQEEPVIRSNQGISLPLLNQQAGKPLGLNGNSTGTAPRFSFVRRGSLVLTC